MLCGFLLGVRPAPTGLVLQLLPIERDELCLTLELLPGAAALERRVVCDQALKVGRSLAKFSYAVETQDA